VPTEGKFSPDGRYVVYSLASPNGCFATCDLWLMEIATGRACLIMKDAPAHQYAQIPSWSADSRWLT
jgi:Tol biopolymer transport system component